MAEGVTKGTDNTAVNVPADTGSSFRPLEALRREVDQLFENFGLRSKSFGLDMEPFWRGDFNWGKAPAVDCVETDDAYVVTAEFPGMTEKDISVDYADGVLTIQGEKKEEKAETRKHLRISERRYGAFQRGFAVPNGIESDKIDATIKNGLLTVTMPKSPEAAKNAKKITIKAADAH